MLQKNLEKQKRKVRQTWVGYYQKVTKDKTKYSRKIKHRKKQLVDLPMLLLYNMIRKWKREVN